VVAMSTVAMKKKRREENLERQEKLKFMRAPNKQTRNR
jgi:hypothetical protein